jgi:hypothetical protein
MSEYRRWLSRKASSMNMRARKVGARGVITPEMLAAKPERCWYCHIDLEPGHGTFDHRVALDKGGSNTYDNIERCCVTCQRQKFTKSEDEFLQYVAEGRITCQLPGCENTWVPRFAEQQRGMAKFCSRSHAAKYGASLRAIRSR